MILPDALELKEYKMGKLFMDYFINFANRDFKEMYYRTEWYNELKNWMRKL